MATRKYSKQQVVERTSDYVKEKLKGDTTGHDYFHILRVQNNALKIASGEDKPDLFVVKIAALLHDIADWKFNDGDEKASSRVAKDWLKKQGIDAATIRKICEAIDSVSFKGAGVDTVPKTIEGMIVQDADRLDALGAIGIARAFAYGGKINRELYNPNKIPEMHSTFEAYKKASGSTIAHFYEKLFLLKDMMNTKTARKMAEERHKYMKDFVSRFLEEWKGEL